jgi:hypothetical protein
MVERRLDGGKATRRRPSRHDGAAQQLILRADFWWRQQVSVTDVLQDALAAVLSARCVLSFQAKMS